MTTMSVAAYGVRTLEAAGIGHAFVVAGGGSAFFGEALRKAGSMKYVCCHHEQAASMAAEAYSRVRNSYGLAIVTSGPGASNAITGVLGAWTDHMPTITISGQVFSGQTIGTRPGKLRTLGVQEVDIVPMVQSITKYAVQVRDPETIRYHLERALYEARSGRPGPVWLDVPANIQNAQIDPEALEGYEPPRSAVLDAVARAEARDLTKAAADVLVLLQAARRPVLHVGQGVRLAGAIQDFLRFAEASGIPVLTARNGNDMIDSAHPLYIGRPGTFAQRGANFAVQTCDLYLAIGTRLSLAQTGYCARDYARNAKVVMVDVDRAELDKDTVPVHLKVQADAGAFLHELMRAMGQMGNVDSAAPSREGHGSGFAPSPRVLPDWSAWLARCKALQAKYPPVTEDQRDRIEGAYVNSYGLVELLSDLCTPDDVIVTDVGFAFQVTSQAWRIKTGQRLLSNCGTAGMGWGLPAAIGACTGAGRRRTICVTGDGGLMMNVQELATIAHHKLPVKIFILNNGGYLTMRQSQAHAFDGYMGSDAGSGISFPDFEKLAAAHGIDFLRATERLSMDGIVRATLHRDDPCICEVMMDPDQPQIPKSINRREADGTIRQTPIEDAWPHLPAEEIAEALKV